MKAGIFTIDITPPFPMPMGGFGGRADLFDCAHDPLLLTAVYLADSGSESWIVAADLVQFPDGLPFREGISQVSAELRCPPEALFLNASHTHGSPLMSPKYGVETTEKQVHRSPENQKLVYKYFEFLWAQVTKACQESRVKARSARLLYGEGKSSFPMNRRRVVHGRIENAPNPQGPFDDRLRILAIEGERGGLKAVGLILAAHPTSTGRQHQLTADYVGAWRRAFSEAFGSSITPFFLQACGGDARPASTSAGRSWRKASLDELPQMGRHLLRETVDILSKGLVPLGELDLGMAQDEIWLECEDRFKAPDRCRQLLESEISWERDFAAECLRRIGRGEAIPDRIPLRIHLLKLTNDLVVVGLGCEPLCALGWKIEEALKPTPVLVLGYTNGCFGYLPESGELARGGYETESYLWEPLSGPFKPDTEIKVINAIRDLLSQCIRKQI